jgi:glucose/arabinose dehydrogenase
MSNSRGFLRAVGLLAAVLWTAHRTDAGYVVERVASGLNQPVYVTQAPGDNSHLYIVERVTPGETEPGNPGRIVKHSLIDGTQTTLYQFPAATTSGDGGVLMMAFHPDFATNGKFYATSEFTESVPRNRIYEFTVDGNGVVTQDRIVLEYDNFTTSHSVDWLGFKPLATGAERNHLYVTTGDGGVQIVSGNFVNRSQNLSMLYGKMLRIDVSEGTDDYAADPKKNFGIPDDNPYANDGNPATLGEVFASGFRNPYRASFDRNTGDLYIGDVGFQAREEIDFLKAGTSGQDFGWAKREGTIGSSDPDHTGPQGSSLNPIYEYAHQAGVTAIRGFSVTAGYVYRGSIPELQGRYFFGDFVTAGIYSTAFDRDTDPGTFNGLNMTGLIDHTSAIDAAILGGGQINLISSFGEDNAGNLYIVDFGESTGGFFPDLGTGELYRLVPDILRGDYNRDGTVNAADYAVWRDTIGNTVASGDGADGNFTGMIDAGDYMVWQANLGNTLGEGAITAVPEPTATSLALLALLICAVAELASVQISSARC